MLINQLSVFIENKKGTLASLTDILLKNDLDIRAIAVFDTNEFGIVRLIVDDPDRALTTLKKEGFIAKSTKVIAIEPEDKPGSLNEIFRVMGENDINIEYIYSFVMRKHEMPYVVFKVDNQEKALKVLGEGGINLVSKEKVHSK
ncbi:MAG: ACT domain-containing protein [Eubacteriales bacterium]